MEDNSNTIIWSLENLEEIRIENPKRALFIIGNGFDLFHGVQSRYLDFRNWLERTSNRGLIEELEEILNSDSLWFDFETELGNITINQNLDLVSEGLELFDAYNPNAQSADFFLAIEFATNTIRDLIHSLNVAFSRWIASLTINSDYKPFREMLHYDAMYMTFNYTEFLETQYCIPEKNICYIHGNRKSGKNNLVFGHPIESGLDGDTDPPHSPYFTEQRKYQLFYDAQETAIDCLSRYDLDITKDIFEVIRSHKCFFQAQAWIKDVIVIGHSLSIVDLPYFEHLQKIFKHRDEVVWHITYHTKYDLERINTFVRDMRLNIRQIRLIRLD